MEVGVSLNIRSLPDYVPVRYAKMSLIWGCLGPRAGLDVFGEKKMFVPAKTDPRTFQPAPLKQHAHNIWQATTNISPSGNTLTKFLSANPSETDLVKYSASSICRT
jgi:hypothetical protein